MILALATCGCSYTYRLGSLFGKDSDDDKPAQTATVTPTSVTTAALPPDGDLVFAKAAAAEALNRGGKDVSVPWENPRSGARGSVTPVATSYVLDGVVCRDFIASHVNAGTESWLQGEACRMPQGGWEVRSLRPWKRP